MSTPRWIIKDHPIGVARPGIFGGRVVLGQIVEVTGSTITVQIPGEPEAHRFSTSTLTRRQVGGSAEYLVDPYTADFRKTLREDQQLAALHRIETLARGRGISLEKLAASADGILREIVSIAEREIRGQR